METRKKHGKTWNMVLPCFFLLRGYFAGEVCSPVISVKRAIFREEIFASK